MSTVKNQHYVPQFYLRNFSLNKKQLYVFDKINAREFTSSINSVASSRFYYDWKELDDIAGKQFIENTLSVLEGAASVKLNELILRIETNNFRGFEEEEKLIISEFIWYQMIRTPKARVQGNHFARVLEQELWQNDLVMNL